MASSDEETSRLFRIRSTVMQMLKDRGYVIVEDDTNLSKTGFIERYGNPVRRDELVINRYKRGDNFDQVPPLFRSLSLRAAAA